MSFTPRQSGDPRIDYPEEGHRFPYLMHFISTYFHQDWDFEMDDPDAIVESYGREGDSQDVRNVVKDIESFLASHANTDEKELSDVFDKMFGPGEYFWLVKSRTLREGLLEIMRILATPAPSKDP